MGGHRVATIFPDLLKSSSGKSFQTKNTNLVAQNGKQYFMCELAFSTEPTEASRQLETALLGRRLIPETMCGSFSLEKERAQVSHVLPENTFVGYQDSLLSPPEICMLL